MCRKAMHTAGSEPDLAYGSLAIQRTGDTLILDRRQHLFSVVGEACKGIPEEGRKGQNEARGVNNQNRNLEST